MRKLGWMKHKLESRFSGEISITSDMYKVDFKKAEEPKVKLPTAVGSQKKQENTRKTSISA